MSDPRPDPDLLALAHATEPDPATLEAVWRGVEARRAPRRPGLPLLLGAGLAAAAVLAVLLVATTRRPEAVPRPVASEAWAQDRLLPHVALSFRGDGVLDPSPDAPLVDWRWGEVVVDVTPGSGPPVTVRTPEATVAVLGTRFTVARSVLGTQTRVERGLVAVTCAGEVDVHQLAAGQSAWCLPTTPAQLLARVDRLVADGAPPDVVRASIDRGLDRAGEDQPLVTAELLLRRMEQDAAAGRSTLQDALAYLALGATARRQEVLTALARETYQAGGCDAGRASLEALHRETGAPEVGVLLATCLADAEPVRARALLEEALGGELDPTWRASAEAWAGSLTP